MSLKWQKILACLLSFIAIILIACGGGNISVHAQSVEDVNRGRTVKGLETFLETFGNAIAGTILKNGAGVIVSYDSKGERIITLGEDRGLLGQTGVALDAITTLPISGTNYIASSLEDMGLNLAQPVKAQGYGYYSLTGIQDAWRIFRNVAFVAFTIIILVVGFMILFGQKLDGQLTLTVQQALPNIIIGMILVAFSYAIAGLMIDLMYLLMYLFGGLFELPKNSPNEMMGNSVFDLSLKMISGGWNSTWDLVGGAKAAIDNKPNSDKNIFDWLASTLIFFLANTLGLVLAIVVFFAMLIAIWKLFVTLLKSYVLIILNVIFAPMLLLLGAVPGYTGGFKRWFAAMIGNLSAFVGVFILLTIYYFLANIQETAAGSGAGSFFTPPFIIPVGGDQQVSLALAALMLGLLLTMPSLIEKIREKMGAKSGFLGTMAKEALNNVKAATPMGLGATAGIGAVTATNIAKGMEKVGGGSTTGFRGKIADAGAALSGRLKTSGISPRAAFASGSRLGQVEGRKIASSGPVKYVAEKLSKRQESYADYVNAVGQAKMAETVLSGIPTNNQTDVMQAKIAAVKKWLFQYTLNGEPGQKQFVFWYDSGKPKPPSA